MKSLLFTAILSMGVAHTGAFLDVWELPHVKNHMTIKDLGRKLNNVTNWNEKTDSLRDRRDKAADENYALYDNQPDGRNAKEPASGSGYKIKPIVTRRITTK